MRASCNERNENIVENERSLPPTILMRSGCSVELRVRRRRSSAGRGQQGWRLAFLKELPAKACAAARWSAQTMKLLEYSGLGSILSSVKESPNLT